VRYAHGPVLCFRPPPEEGGRVVIAATDLSDPALPAMRRAVDEARDRDARLVVVHAFDFGRPSWWSNFGSLFGVPALLPSAATAEDVKKAVRTMLHEALASMNAVADIEILEGPAAHAVVAHAEACRAELIVVATRGRTGLARMPLGSVAERIVEHASCSVLAVREHVS
jgi:nucleotide-binding universal stress UspA family protein